MNKLFYLLLASVLFLLLHILILFLKLNDGLNFVAILCAMVLTQFLAFSLIRNKSADAFKTFSSIFIALAVTQFFSVTLLTLYSAFDPFGDPKTIHLVDVLTSIVIFVFMLPLLVASILWFTKVRNAINSAK